MGGLDGALNDQAEAGIMKESERKNDRRTLRFNWSMAADGCLSLFLPVKWEFFLPNIVKCLLKGGSFNCLGFWSFIVWTLPYNIKCL